MGNPISPHIVNGKGQWRTYIELVSTQTIIYCDKPTHPFSHIAIVKF